MQQIPICKSYQNKLFLFLPQEFCRISNQIFSLSIQQQKFACFEATYLIIMWKQKIKDKISGLDHRFCTYKVADGIRNTMELVCEPIYYIVMTSEGSGPDFTNSCERQGDYIQFSWCRFAFILLKSTELCFQRYIENLFY